MPLKKGRSGRIILELLHHPGGTLSKYRIAQDTDTNISWVIMFLRRLEHQKIILGTKVLNIDQLVDEYLAVVPPPKSWNFFIRNPLEYLQKIKLKYALTTYAAENFTSYHLFLSRYDLYIKKNDLQQWTDSLFQEGLVGGGNFRLLIPFDEYIFKFMEKRKKLNLVSIPLLMIDLKREGGVCMEAYEYLVKKYV